MTAQRMILVIYQNIQATLRRGLLGFLLFSLFLMGCSRRATDEKRIQPEYDKQSGRLRILRYDGNGDGIAETVSHMDGARVVSSKLTKTRTAWSIDGDYDANQRLESRVFARQRRAEDAWSFARPDGSIEHIEISLERDGKVTRREFYQSEQIVRAEEDGDGDGRTDKWETYEAGRLAAVAFDTSHRGAPDRRLVYGPGGSAQLEVDPDGDGTFVAQK